MYLFVLFFFNFHGNTQSYIIMYIKILNRYKGYLGYKDTSQDHKKKIYIYTYIMDHNLWL